MRSSGTANDRHLAGFWRHGSLNRGESYTVAHWVTLPNNLTGDWWLFVVPDASNHASEFIYEGNNTSDPVPLTIRSPDLQVTEVTAPAPRRWVSLHFELDGDQRRGGPPTSSWYDRVVLSQNDIHGDGDDVQVSNFPHSGVLQPGASYTRDGSLVLNIYGGYHLFVVADAYDWLAEYPFGNRMFPGPIG